MVQKRKKVIYKNTQIERIEIFINPVLVLFPKDLYVSHISFTQMIIVIKIIKNSYMIPSICLYLI
jgi:predicted RNA-binding protein